MYNLIKSEMLKFKWSNYIIGSTLSIIILFIVYLLADSATFLYKGDRYIAGGGIGFISSIYGDINNPTFGEIMRTSMVGTGFIWIIILIISVSFFMSEYTENTIRLSIAYGHSKFKMYISKLSVISVYSLMLYCFLTLLIFTHSIIKLKFTPDFSEILIALKLITLNFLVIEVFIMISLLVSIIVKHIGAISAIICFFILSLPMVYMMVWDKLASQSILIKIFLKINPMYYWSTISAYNIDNNIIYETVVYVILATIFLIPLSYFLLRREEVK
ncbi:MAG: ABC transporter permease subunit [Peptostreptococcaceae bacterium]